MNYSNYERRGNTIRNLNRVELIGNLTRDPELRFTGSGQAVTNMGLATNRSWKTDGGEAKEETEFHTITVWGKLAEICSQHLTKGRRVYIEGRLQTRKYENAQGVEVSATEIVATDMIMLDNKQTNQQIGGDL